MNKEQFQVSIEDVMGGLAIPPEMLAGLHSLAQLDPQVVTQISASIDSLTGLNQDDGVLSTISEQLPESQREVGNDLLNVMRSVSLDEVPKVIAAVTAWASRKDERKAVFSDELLTRLKPNLETLVQEHASIELMKKADRLIRDTGDELDSIKFICDLRPVFDKPREHVDALVLIANLRIRYISQNGQRNSCELALTEEDLRQFKEKTEEAISKLAVLKRIAGSLRDNSRTGGEDNASD